MDFVSLNVDGESFACSKSKLASNSPYFDAMFYGSFIEKDKNEVVLKDVDKNSVKHLVEYVKNPKDYLLNFTKSDSEKEMSACDGDLCALLEVANMFQFKDVIDQCLDILSDHLSIKNSLIIWQVAERTGAETLTRQARATSLWYFDSIIETDSFVALDIEFLERYASDSSLHSLTGELGVWHGLDIWINHSLNERIHFLPNLVKCLRFCSIPDCEIRTLLLYSSIRQFPKILEALEMMLNKSLEFPNRGDKRNVETSSLVTPPAETDVEVLSYHDSFTSSKPRSLPYVASVVAEDSETSTYNVCYWSFEDVTLKSLVKLDKIESGCEGFAGFKVLEHGPKLFLFGGETILRSRSWNTSVWQYDLILKKWIFFDTLPQPRRHMMSCILDNELYILGGFGRFRIKQTAVCKINVENNKDGWINCAPLPVHLFSAPCCSFKGQIYVIGSYIYVYDKRTDRWSTLDGPVPAQEGLNSALVHGDFIYLTGELTKNIYRVNPSQPGAKFEVAGELQFPSSQSCIVSDRLYSFSQALFSDLISFEVFDLVTGESVFLWSGGCERYRFISRHHHGCCPALNF